MIGNKDQPEERKGFFKRLRARINRGDSWLTYDLANLAPGTKTLTGVFLGAEAVLNHARVHAMIDGILGDVAQGELVVVIDRSFPLAEAAEAHRFIESRAAFGRVLLEIPR